MEAFNRMILNLVQYDLLVGFLVMDQHRGSLAIFHLLLCIILYYFVKLIKTKFKLYFEAILGLKVNLINHYWYQLVVSLIIEAWLMFSIERCLLSTWNIWAFCWGCFKGHSYIEHSLWEDRKNIGKLVDAIFVERGKD